MPIAKRRALRALARTALVLGGVWLVAHPAWPASDRERGELRPAQVHYEGTLELEGDYRRPGETRSFHSRQSFYTSHGGRLRLDWTTWAEGDSARIPESFLVVGDSVFHRETPSARWALLAGRKAHEGLLQAAAGLPAELGRLVSEHRAAWRVGLRGNAARPDRFTEKWAHPRLGDVSDSVAYTWGGSRSAPSAFRMVLHERDTEWRMTQRQVSWSNVAPPESLLRSPSVFSPPSGAPDRLVDEPAIVARAPGVWSADMEDIGSRTLIVEFEDHVALIEVAVGSMNGERLADAVRHRWPGKPIRYAFFGHHHPHYVGGIRAMIAEGATVVTTPLNEAVVKKMAALPFTIEPDRLARAPRPLKTVVFSDRFELADSMNQLVAFNYGARSKHTDEFVVFWLPRAKLLFESSLGWQGPEGKVRISGGVAPLLAWADEQHLSVDRVVQSWPMRGTAAQVSRAELDSLVQAVKRK